MKSSTLRCVGFLKRIRWPFKGLGLRHYLPQGPSLNREQCQNWLAQAQTPITYTGAPRVPFPVVPFQVFALHYEEDIVVETNHPDWQMHEFARVVLGDRSIWLAKDSDGSGIQTITAEFPEILQWLPEIPVSRLVSRVDVQDTSSSEALRICLTYTNPRGELTTLDFSSPRPPKKIKKRNGSTFSHSQDVVAAVLDIPARQTKYIDAKMTYDGKPARIRKILGLIPVQALLEQTQTGFAAASMRLTLHGEQLRVDCPIPAHSWPTQAQQIWRIEPHRLYLQSLTHIWEYALEKNEVSTVTVRQADRAKPLLQVLFSAPLPDLSRPFAGCVVRHFVMMVNGQMHGHGSMRAVSYEDRTVLDIQPAAPVWFADRPMQTRLDFVGHSTVDLMARRVQMGN